MDKFLYINFVVVLWLTAVTTFFLGVFVLFKNRRSIINKTFALYSFSITWWSFSEIWGIACDRKITALIWTRIEQVGVFFIPTFFIHFIISLLGIKNKKWLLRVAYFFSSVFAILSATPLMMVDSVQTVPYVKYFGTPGVVYHFAILFFVILTIIGLNLLYHAYIQAYGAKRNQLKYLFWSSLFGYGGGAANFLLVYGITIPILNPFGTYTLLVYIAVVAYVILRYRLMDINVAVTRAGIFFMLYALILGIPFWIGFKLGLWIYSTIIMAALATAGPFIYQYLHVKAEDVLLRDQRRYQKALRELSKAMARIRDVDQLLKTISSTIIDNVGVGFAAIYVKDDEYKAYKLSSYSPQTEKSRFQEFIPLDYPLVSRLNREKRPLMSEEVGPQDKIDLNSGIVIPCFMEDTLLAFIALGAKPNNQMYTPDDVLIFETLSYSTSLAIENSIFWKEIEERQRQARVQEMNLFSYSLAHEIDNPMAVIIGHADLLKKYFLKENLPEEKQKEAETDLDYILEAAHRVSGMVDAIQDLGKRTTGEFQPLRLEEVIESFCKLYEPIFKFETVYFTRDIPQRLPWIRGVKAELMQILVIFSNNALHALLGTLEKEKRIRLKVELSNPDWIRISFSDNGYGITLEKLHTIFAPFVTTKASTEGTGMGLYNAKKIIERHKGKLWAESGGEGKGATFIIELPTAKDITEEDLKERDDLKIKGKMLFGFGEEPENGK
jgi:signal transduction histidine kinase